LKNINLTKKPMQDAKRTYPVKVAIAAGLYPFLHYYNSNFDLADSWLQLGFLLAISFGLPLLLIAISKPIFKISWLHSFEKYRLTAVNLVVFSGLIALLVFLGNKKTIAVVLLLGGLLSFVVYRQLNKIIIIQFLLAALSFVTLVPRLWFMVTYDASWTQIETSLQETTLKKTPNIYVIQPDGYANFSYLDKPPYNFDNSAFENMLETKGFVNYPDFRSNYYSTLTSNSSMFAMKHHYYQNTYPGNLKTFGSQEVVVGEYNNTLQILERNGYTTHFITDNSYFLVNRKQTAFDYCNVDQGKVKLYDSGGVPDTDIVTDFNHVMGKLEAGPNFFFIEKTLPSHVTHEKGYTLGIAGEREKYLERLELANIWLTELLDIIYKNDDNPMIVLVADHGGYVGLKYVQEVETRKLTAEETISAYNSLLAIRWPEGVNTDVSIKTNVNLFRNIFAVLSENRSLLATSEPNTSYIPMYDSFLGASYYKCISEDYKVVFDKIPEE
tara:strand:+ start:304 stop:1794 length:1491 start_codon:yes stop_codon:yes gene_type:complete